MKKSLAVLLLVVALVGCGDSNSTADNTETEQLKEKAAAATTPKGNNLATCPDCEKRISYLAVTCPGCGRPLHFVRDAVAALEKMETVEITRDDRGKVVKLNTFNSGMAKFSDADLAHVKVLRNLEELYLFKSQITGAGLAHIKDLKTLKVLDLSWTETTDAGLAHLKDLTNLEDLRLQNSAITDAGLVHLKGLTSLKQIRLHNSSYDRPWRNKITDAGLAHLAGLNLKATRFGLPKEVATDLGLKHYLAAIEPSSTLRLNGWPITDASIVHLKKLTHLKGLSLRGTEISATGIAELQKALPDCEIQH